MIRRITKTLLIASMLVGLAYARPSVCRGWSLNPFASNDQEQTRMVPVNATQQPPSAWEKVTSGTKNFFNKTGETLGLKKKEPKKAPPVVAARPRTIPQKPKPGMFSWLKPKETKKDNTVSGWLHNSDQIVP